MMVETRSAPISAYSIDPLYLMGGYGESRSEIFLTAELDAGSGQPTRGYITGPIGFLELEADH